MVSHQIRSPIHPRAPARGPARPIRASDIILGLTLAMLLIGLVALAITHLLAS